MPLRNLSISHGTFSDLSPLSNMPLEILGLYGCNAVQDIGPLRGLRLTSLTLSNTGVTNIEAIAGMPLRALKLLGCKVGDMSPLTGMKLEVLYFSPKYVKYGVDALRNMSTLARLNGSKAPEFWRRYDAGEFGQPGQSGDESDQSSPDAADPPPDD
jgi:Leucine-rich repeat (LRR) protein